MTRIRIVMLGALVFLLTSAGSAMAVYETNGAQAQGNLASSSGSGSLPFTGLDLALIAIGGVALLAVGFVLRRAGRERRSNG